MKMKYEYNFKFKRAGDNVADQDWKTRREAYIEAWKESSLVLTNQTYDHNG
jgi:hypothetical protein